MSASITSSLCFHCVSFIDFFFEASPLLLCCGRLRDCLSVGGELLGLVEFRGVLRGPGCDGIGWVVRTWDPGACDGQLQYRFQGRRGQQSAWEWRRLYCGAVERSGISAHSRSGILCRHRLGGIRIVSLLFSRIFLKPDGSGV